MKKTNHPNIIKLIAHGKWFKDDKPENTNSRRVVIVLNQLQGIIDRFCTPSLVLNGLGEPEKHF